MRIRTWHRICYGKSCISFVPRLFHRKTGRSLGTRLAWSSLGTRLTMHRQISGHLSSTRGPPRRVSAYEISKSTGFQVDFGFQNGFLDFWISKWISGFQSGFLISGFQSGFLDFKVDFSRDFWISSEFLDFKADFWISKWISRGISGFQANFWISKRISGFHLNRYYSKIELKYTHDSSTAFLSACMLTECKVTGTSPLHSA